MNTPNFPLYRAFLLRLWQEQAGSEERAAVWRLSLEDPKTGQRRGFASLEELTTFLAEQIAGMDRRPNDHKISDSNGGA